MSEWKFKRDTAFRKQFFVPDSFAHPAKMDAQLLIKIVETYTKPGEVILDPMGGMGTTMLACTLGRNVVLVELEQKFVRMQVNNWEIVRMYPQLGSGMGGCYCLWGDARDVLSVREHPYRDLWVKHPKLDYPTIKSIRRHNALPLLGDARNLEGLLADKIITSPPFGVAFSGGGIAKYGHFSDPELAQRAYSAENMNIKRQIKRVEEGKAKMKRPDVFTSEGNIAAKGYFEGDYSKNPSNIGNLPYGNIDSIITSPPYEGLEARDRSKEVSFEREKSGEFPKRGDLNISSGYQADAVITSPPYEEAMGEKHHSPAHERISKDKHWDTTYTERGAKGNIGNLKSDSYLTAMLQVYAQCYKVLKSGGLMILVTKNFIRNKKIVRLDEDTVKLCEQVGFRFIERHYRELSAQSFWRVIYKQKYPDAPEIKYEDIIVLGK